ncbi:hypothetical protein C8R45DRAFT_1069769 [Mycena sanguinolenta]|nr:hypothetical protein C8R45DRAFT_1069769 [Mycena sanguinolenta]
MMLSSILFNPAARVYTLRALLASIIFLIASSAYYITPSSVACGLVIWLHHILAVFNWTLRGLALIDVVAVMVEIGLIIPVFGFVLLPVAIIALLLLCLCLLFRITTILKTEQRIWQQRFVFLGCCKPSNPPFTPVSILLNRSLARPLVRGESKYIIIARAVALSCIGIALPAFGIYVTMVKPVAAGVSTTLVVDSNPWAFWSWDDYSGGNATLSFAPANEFSNPGTPWGAVVTVLDFTSNSSSCSTMGPHGFIATCPLGWSDIQTISVSAAVPLEVGLVNVNIGCWSGQCDDRIGIPLLPGSRLFGLLAWSQRQTLDKHVLVYSPEIHGLQSNNSIEGNITSLTLTQISDGPIRFFRDTAEAPVLSGIAAFGGFWTFVNGTFALFFGANVVYFAFGRKPLSALGVVHLFQRRTLVRQWYEDFPAVQTEGGLPGSANAGIVAFIRKRLVDLGEDPRVIDQRPREPRWRPNIGSTRMSFP